MDLNTKVSDEYMIPIENLVNPRALDFHAETNYIYFADTTSFLIGRQKIDGTERETILKDGRNANRRFNTYFYPFYLPFESRPKLDLEQTLSFFSYNFLFIFSKHRDGV